MTVIGNPTKTSDGSMGGKFDPPWPRLFYSRRWAKAAESTKGSHAITAAAFLFRWVDGLDQLCIQHDLGVVSEELRDGAAGLSVGGGGVEGFLGRARNIGGGV